MAKHGTCNKPSLPGTVGTFAFFIVSLAVDLSPMTRMLSGCHKAKQEFAYHSFCNYASDTVTINMLYSIL